jgi:hypothetical protein
MGTRHGYHARYSTDVVTEIAMAKRLYEGSVMRVGIIKIARVFRTDPAAALARLSWCRVKASRDAEYPWAPAAGVPYMANTVPPMAERATNAEILTPSHDAWSEFRERLAGHLACPDFGDYFGPAGSDDYWPLCSATLIAEMGFAVAESLTVFRVFVGESDADIAALVERAWAKTRPTRSRPGGTAADPETLATRGQARDAGDGRG